MLPTNRRAVLGAAATGGLMLPSFLQTAEAQHLAQPMPAGPKVVERTRHEEIPQFKYSLDGGHAKVTSGGWSKEVTAEQLPISQGITGVHMFMNPGASRELHWHATAAEWAYILEGTCQATVLDPAGNTEVLNFEPGDIWYFPRGHGHSVQTIGREPCHFLLAFDSGHFSENGTFSITDWMSLTPPEVLARNFGLPASTFQNFPKGETYIMQGAIIEKDSPQAQENVSNAGARTHKYRLSSHKPQYDQKGGSLHLASAREFPISTTMTGGIMRMEPGVIREMHWHPQANEWQYFIKGQASIGLFGASGRNRIESFGPGDVSYVPAGYGHYVENTGKETLEMLVIFDRGEYQEISLSNWIATSPPWLLSNNFGVDEKVLARFPKVNGIIRQG
ncbi:MAG TPA: cupin domain-containing protein [Crenalkalicoccus sp.]|jgi:oxalate decarboxylase|nr:cupin domain-containing protein [Crenalkalicoccus sp.]